jgi:hypothetical protein
LPGARQRLPFHHAGLVEEQLRPTAGVMNPHSRMNHLTTPCPLPGAGAMRRHGADRGGAAARVAPRRPDESHAALGAGQNRSILTSWLLRMIFSGMT